MAEDKKEEINSNIEHTLNRQLKYCIHNGQEVPVQKCKNFFEYLNNIGGKTNSFWTNSFWTDISRKIFSGKGAKMYFKIRDGHINREQNDISTSKIDNKYNYLEGPWIDVREKVIRSGFRIVSINAGYNSTLCFFGDNGSVVYGQETDVFGDNIYRAGYEN